MDSCTTTTAPVSHVHATMATLLTRTTQAVRLALARVPLVALILVLRRALDNANCAGPMMTSLKGTLFPLSSPLPCLFLFPQVLLFLPTLVPQTWSALGLLWRHGNTIASILSRAWSVVTEGSIASYVIGLWVFVLVAAVAMTRRMMVPLPRRGQQAIHRMHSHMLAWCPCCHCAGCQASRVAHRTHCPQCRPRERERRRRHTGPQASSQAKVKARHYSQPSCLEQQQHH